MRLKSLHKAKLHICAVRTVSVQTTVTLSIKEPGKKFSGILLLMRFKARCTCKTRSIKAISYRKWDPVFYSAIHLSFKANPVEAIPHWHAGGLDSLIGLFHL